MRRTLATGIFVILGLSLFANYTSIRSKQNMVINGGNEARFSDWGPNSTMAVDGCLAWTDPTKQSENFKQYWKIVAHRQDGKFYCELIEATQMNGSVIIGNQTSCELKALDTETKTATILFHDATITVNRERTIWVTTNPEEKDGGELVPCWDKRLNWRLF